MTETIIILAGLIFWLRIEYANIRSADNSVVIRELAQRSDRNNDFYDLHKLLSKAEALPRQGGCTRKSSDTYQQRNKDAEKQNLTADTAPLPTTPNRPRKAA